MPFEYDFAKSKNNQTKHGISFKEAERLWEGEVLELSSIYPNESRKLCIGKIDKTFWTAIVTYRAANIRIISVRRARDNEKEIYLKKYP